MMMIAMTIATIGRRMKKLAMGLPRGPGPGGRWRGAGCWGGRGRRSAALDGRRRGRLALIRSHRRGHLHARLDLLASLDHDALPSLQAAGDDVELLVAVAERHAAGRDP